MSNKITFQKFEITADYKGIVKKNIHEYIIKVKNIDTGAEITFKYKTLSIFPILKDKRELLNAFHSFVLEASFGEQDFGDFQYDYENHVEDIEEVYSFCKSASEELRTVYNGNIFELLESLEREDS